MWRREKRKIMNWKEIRKKKKYKQDYNCEQFFVSFSILLNFLHTGPASRILGALVLNPYSIGSKLKWNDPVSNKLFGALIKPFTHHLCPVHLHTHTYDMFSYIIERDWLKLSQTDYL